MTSLRNASFTFAGNLDKLRRRSKVTLANNTTAERMDDDDPTQGIGIRLHGHLIGIVYPDTTVAVRHCGWVTVTTFDRLNRILPDGWRASFSKGKPRAYDKRDTHCVLFNGVWLVIDANGGIRYDHNPLPMF